jgi:hypothetical protein
MLKPLIMSAARLSVRAYKGLLETNSAQGSIARADAAHAAMPNLIPSDQQAYIISKI